MGPKKDRTISRDFQLQKPKTKKTASVYMGTDNATTGETEICSSTTQYIDFTITNSDYRGNIIYNSSETSFSWLVGASRGSPPHMNSLPSGFSVNGTSVSSDRIFQCYENNLRKHFSKQTRI